MEAPAGFVGEVRVAAGRGRVGRLGLLGVEAGGYERKMDGLRVVKAGLARVGGVGARRVAYGLGLAGQLEEQGGGQAVVFTGHRIDS